MNFQITAIKLLIALTLIFLLAAAARVGAQTPSIGYTLPRAGKVSLAVYDAQGRQVRTLLAGQKDTIVLWADEMGRTTHTPAINANSGVCNIHATILHQFGLDHTRLAFRQGGRDQRLADVPGRVIREVLA